MGPTAAAAQLRQMPLPDDPLSISKISTIPGAPSQVLLPALETRRRLASPAPGDAVELVRVIRTVVDPVAHHSRPDAGVRMRDALEVAGLAGVGSRRRRRCWTHCSRSGGQVLVGRELAAFEVCLRFGIVRYFLVFYGFFSVVFFSKFR